MVFGGGGSADMNATAPWAYVVRKTLCVDNSDSSNSVKNASIQWGALDLFPLTAM